MRIIDLSQPLYDRCPNCPAHAPVRIEVVSTHAAEGEESWHVEQISMSSHTGSHVDAPLHKVPGGKSLDDLPLEAWTGPARIVDLRGIRASASIGAAMLEEKLSGPVADQWILLATGWGDKRARTSEWLYQSPTLSEEAARWLVERGARGVGIDHYSIGGAAAHAILLARPVLIVEELHFPQEAFELPQPVQFQALPIHLRAHSGAPCRPVLLIPRM